MIKQIVVLISILMIPTVVFSAQTTKDKNQSNPKSHLTAQNAKYKKKPKTKLHHTEKMIKDNKPSYAKPHFVFSLGGGAGFTSDVGTSTTFPIVNPITDEKYSYSASNDSQFAGIFSAFLGSEWLLPRNFGVQAGLAYYYFGNLEAQGVLTQGADPGSSDLYNYQYRVMTQQLLAESKWFYVYQAFHPYVSLGLGVAFNKADNYEVDIPAFTTFSRMYANNSNTSFSYNLGLGLDYAVLSYARLGIGYRFTDLGEVSLGNAAIDNINVSGTLSQSHLYINEVLAQITFLI